MNSKKRGASIRFLVSGIVSFLLSLSFIIRYISQIEMPGRALDLAISIAGFIASIFLIVRWAIRRRPEKVETKK